MRGFIVIQSQETVNAAIEKGSVSILISNKEGDYSVYVGGMDVDGVFYTWISRKLVENDSFEIRLSDFEPSSVSEFASKRDVRDEESENNLLLEAYYRLRNELVDEGLLKEDIDTV